VEEEAALAAMGGKVPFILSKAMNEVDAGRDRTTPASVRHLFMLLYASR
jgi:hypothetical protein